MRKIELIVSILMAITALLNLYYLQLELAAIWCLLSLVMYPRKVLPNCYPTIKNKVSVHGPITDISEHPQSGADRYLSSCWRGDIMLNKILRLFGLMTINQARIINRENAALLHRTWAEWAKRDFGAPINPDGVQQNRVWSDDTFAKMLNHTEPDTTLVGIWEIDRASQG